MINYSQMQSSSRLISGNDSNFEKLEKLLSNLPNHVPLNGIIDQIINDATKHAGNTH